ncbi:TetR family transcriptional regulator [Archangium violaceum]|uniref:TetR/AcrR family transcriptional regulator n=1 Tax=Archangium violaceum TaxID=83451 RepID=UPI0019501857|nr:TetR family transcriptional regulator [Archangium violaceum]QRN97909.1 TetR family transcriptional regulator [Archangium violaceum]
MPQRLRAQPQERPAPGADREPAPLTLAPREGRDQAMLEASRAVIGLFMRERTSDFTVKELAAHAGLSERTFYRYFPRKEDAIRPAVDAALARVVSDMRAAPRGRPLHEAMVAALHQSIAEEHSMNWENLLPVLNETESLRAVWLQILTDAEVALAHVVAEWLGIFPDSQRARLAGAVLATAGRLALEQPFSAGRKRDPGEVLAECLELLGPALLEEPAGGRGPVRRSPPRRSRRERG